MSMMRFDPFNERLTLRDAVNQLFEESFVQPSRMGTRTMGMPLDLSETENAFVVDAVVPGVKPDDIDILLQDNVLTITAEARQEQQTTGQVHRIERSYGRFSRSIALPMHVKADQVQATLENGVLHLEIPKADQAKPRKIRINTGRALEGQTVDVATKGEQGQAKHQ